MTRDDLPALRALGFKDDELRALDLWDPAAGPPADLAEMYVRRSQKKDTLSALREQVRRMCAHAAHEGKRVRHVWFEQRSASKAHVRREEFEKATAAITVALSSKTLYAFKTSRLSRRGMGQVGPLLDQLDECGSRICIVAEGIDSTRSRMILAILSEQAREQAADIAEFTKLGVDAHKAEGQWMGGVAPYGLCSLPGSGKLSRLPSEYPTARRIADLLLERVTPGRIADILNSEGCRTRHGKLWAASGIIKLAHSVAWAGLAPNREKLLSPSGKDEGKYHRGGTPLLNAQGHPISCGEGAVSFAEHVKINAILAERARPGTSVGLRTRGKREIVTLLTGVARCGRCGGRMANGGINYRCAARHEEGPSSCAGVSTDRARVDDAAATLWINHVLNLQPGSPTLRAIARGWLAYEDPEKEQRKGQLTAALESAGGRRERLGREHFVHGRISETEYAELRGMLDVQIAGLNAELAELAHDDDLAPLTEAEPLTHLWLNAGIGGQRALLRAVLVSLTVSPPRYRGDRAPILGRLVPKRSSHLAG